MNDDNQASVQKNNNYPAYITIFLNTRIIGHTKEIYRPNMTIPTISSSSKSIYFNPLIKLNKNIVKTIPKGKTESFIYEQFFNSNLFNSLLIRSQYYPQPKRTIDEASKEGIIDNNIEILLDLLFSQNMPFYIDKKRYTCYDYKYKKGSWIIDSINSNELKKKFYNYYQSNINSLIRKPYRYNMSMPSANMQSLIPNSFMVTPSGQTVLYQNPYQLYPSSHSFNIPLQTENPIFQTFNSFKKNVPETVLHGPAATEDFGEIIAEEAKKTENTRALTPKSQRMTADKSIVLQSNTLSPSSNINKTNLQYYNTLIDQYLFYSYDGFKKGFIDVSRLNCSKINNIDDLVKFRRGDFFENKIAKWNILHNQGNGDCLFYSFCQIVNSDDYKKYKIPLKTRQSLFDVSSKTSYYDKTGNYTVAGLRKIISDFIRYTDAGREVWDNMNSLSNINTADKYIIKNNLQNTLLNIETCADINNRTPIKQKELTDPSQYYWGDDIAIIILEYIFELKAIIIHKPNNDINDTIEVYNNSAEDPIIIKNKIRLADYIIIEYEDNNNNQRSVSGYLLSIKITTGRSQTITILRNNNDVNNCTFVKQTIYISSIIAIYIIPKYKIYKTSDTYLLKNTVYDKYFYLFYHENNHYEAMSFNIRDDPRYVFDETTIYDFHPYIIYMIYIYNYMLIDPNGSNFTHTTINTYLNEMNIYYNTSKKITDRYSKLKLLGGTVTTNPSSKTTPSPSPSNYMDQFFVNYFDGEKIMKHINNFSTNIGNKINDKLNQQLDIKPPKDPYISTQYANPNMSYYIIVDLELFPGESISINEKKNLACQIQFDNIRKSYADFLGYQYQPSLLNTSIMPTSINTKSTSSNKNTTKKINKYNSSRYSDSNRYNDRYNNRYNNRYTRRNTY